MTSPYKLWTGTPFLSVGANTISSVWNGSNIVGNSFTVSSQLIGFKAKWYGNAVGVPPAMTLTLYPDNNGKPNFASPIESQTTTSTLTTAQWQGAVDFASTLSPNTQYWIVNSMAGGTSTANYRVGVNWIAPSDGLAFTNNQNQFPSRGNQWGSLIWIQDSLGNDVSIYPAYGMPITGLITGQSFIANGFSFDTVWIFTQDRAWDTTPITINVVSNGFTLASGTMNSAAGYLQTGSGTDSWIPVPLNTVVNTVSGQTYTIKEVVPSSAVTGWVVFEESANPAKAGFQGQGQWFCIALSLGKLALWNFNNENIHQADVVNTINSIAVRFQTGSVASNLLSTDLRIWSGAGTIVSSLYSDNGAGDLRNKPLASLASSTPTIVSGQSWPTMTFSPTQLSPNSYYWIVHSATSGSVLPTRLVNPWKFKTLWWTGTTWGTPPQGPTELSMRIVTDQGEYRNMLDQVSFFSGAGVRADNAGHWVSQSFTTPSTLTQIQSISSYIASGAQAGDSGLSDCEFDLYSGISSPSVKLGSGIIPKAYLSVPAMTLCDFGTPIDVTPNTRYWFVIKGVSGAIRAYAHAYRPGFTQDGYAGGTEVSLVTSNSGSTWTPTLGQVSELLFAVFSPSQATSTGPSPTSLSLSVKAL